MGCSWPSNIFDILSKAVRGTFVCPKPQCRILINKTMTSTTNDEQKRTMAIEAESTLIVSQDVSMFPFTYLLHSGVVKPCLKEWVVATELDVFSSRRRVLPT